MMKKTIKYCGKGGRGLCYLKQLSNLFKSKNNRSRTLFSFVLSLICVLFSDVQAQSAGERAVIGAENIKPLQIGDTIPEVLWDLPLRVVNHPGGKDFIRLSDYRNKKLIILDFWATWCKSCLESFPKVSAMQHKFDKEVQFILINAVQTKDSKEKIARAIDQYLANGNLIFLDQDSVFQQIYPHRILPHYVWLNGDGKLVGSTAGTDLSEENIRNTLAGENPLHQKHDNLQFDRKKSLVEQIGIIKPDSINMSSLLTGYIEGLGRTYGTRSNFGGQSYYVVNYPLSFLYQQAYDSILMDIPPSRYLFLDNVDRSFINKIKSPEEYSSKYCYESIIAAGTIQSAKSLLRENLSRQFQIAVKRVVKEREAFELTGTLHHLASSAGQTVTLGHIARVLGKYFEYPVLVDSRMEQMKVPKSPLIDDISHMEIHDFGQFLTDCGLTYKVVNRVVPHAEFTPILN